MVMRDIRASVEVRALIGASRLRELQGKASTRYECWQCGSQGRTTDATSVIVVGHRAFRVVMLAHAACAESHIIEVGADMMRAVTGATAASPQLRHQGRGAARRLRRSENHPAKRCPP
jgi:hypothetical protein